MRRTPVAAAFMMQHRRGYYLEDETAQYNTKLYMHPHYLKKWYANRELTASRQWMNYQKVQESDAHNAGLHYDGTGAFERELRRKGVQVEKYPLPSRVATARLHEMVWLRRGKVEAAAQAAMAAQRAAAQQAAPSPAWYDETQGPLNPHFLKFAAKSYTEELAPLPREPIRRATLPL
jgi:hypothetical protein